MAVGHYEEQGGQKGADWTGVVAGVGLTPGLSGKWTTGQVV